MQSCSFCLYKKKKTFDRLALTTYTTHRPLAARQLQNNPHNSNHASNMNYGPPPTVTLNRFSFNTALKLRQNTWPAETVSSIAASLRNAPIRDSILLGDVVTQLDPETNATTTFYWAAYLTLGREHSRYCDSPITYKTRRINLQYWKLYAPT